MKPEPKEVTVGEMALALLLLAAGAVELIAGFCMDSWKLSIFGLAILSYGKERSTQTIRKHQAYLESIRDEKKN